MAAVKAIDISKCPKPLQDAWFDYVVALEHAHANDGKINLGAVGKLAGAAAIAQAHPLGALGILATPAGDDTQRRLEESLTSAWYALERVAMSYGVKVER